MLRWLLIAAVIAVCGCGGADDDDDDIAGPDASPEFVDPWMVTAGGELDDSGASIAVGPSGDVYVAGQFRGDIVLGAGQATETRLTAAGGSDGFVARISAGGTLRWARRVGGPSDDSPRAVGVGPDETVYLVATLSATAAYGGPDGLTELPNTGTNGPDNMALLRIEADGTLVWARRVGVTFTAAYDLAVDDDGSVVLGGSFSGTVVFGDGEPGEVELTATTEDLFIARYRDDGTLAFVLSAGETGPAATVEIEIGSDRDITAVGRFFGNATFGAGSAQETTLSSSSVYGEGVFVARFAPDGSLRWASGASGGFIGASGLAVGSDGSATISGLFGSVARFDEGGPRAITLDGIDGFSGSDMFVARYSSDGVFEWARHGAGTSLVSGREVVWLGGGDILVVGALEGYATFGDYTLSAEALDMIAVTYDRNGAATAATALATGAGYESVSDTLLAPNGDLIATGLFTESPTFQLGGALASPISAGRSDFFLGRFAR